MAVSFLVWYSRTVLIRWRIKTHPTSLKREAKERVAVLSPHVRADKRTVDGCLPDIIFFTDGYLPVCFRLAMSPGTMKCAPTMAIILSSLFSQACFSFRRT